MHHRANEIAKQQEGENKGMLKNQGFLEQYADLITMGNTIKSSNESDH